MHGQHSPRLPARTPTSASPAPASSTPAADIYRDGEDIVVTLSLPGLDLATDVTVEVKDNRLVVRGARRDERTEGRLVRELRYGTFARSFDLPKHVTAEAVSASYDAGLLTVRVAGVYAEADAAQITISTGTPAAQTVTSEATEPAESAQA